MRADEVEAGAVIAARLRHDVAEYNRRHDAGDVADAVEDGAGEADRLLWRGVGDHGPGTGTGGEALGEGGERHQRYNQDVAVGKRGEDQARSRKHADDVGRLARKSDRPAALDQLVRNPAARNAA